MGVDVVLFDLFVELAAPGLLASVAIDVFLMVKRKSRNSRRALSAPVEHLGRAEAVRARGVSPGRQSELEVLPRVLALGQEGLDGLDGGFSEPVGLAVVRAGELVDDVVVDAVRGELAAELRPAVAPQAFREPVLEEPVIEITDDGARYKLNKPLYPQITRIPIHQHEPILTVNLEKINTHLKHKGVRNNHLKRSRR